MNLLDVQMNDGSRHFAALPQTVPWNVLRDQIVTLSGTTILGHVTDNVTEAWIDFSYRGHKFSVNTQFGEFWFFVTAPNCPESILQEIIVHCTSTQGTG